MQKCDPKLFKDWVFKVVIKAMIQLSKSLRKMSSSDQAATLISAAKTKHLQGKTRKIPKYLKIGAITVQITHRAHKKEVLTHHCPFSSPWMKNKKKKETRV